MIALGLLFGAIALIVVGIAGAIVSDRRLPSYGSLREGVMVSCFASILIGVCATIAFAVCWPTIYFTSLTDVQNLEAFQYETMPAYLYAIEQTENVVVWQAGDSFIELAYQEQGGFVSERIKELRDKVDWYNAMLRGLRARDGTIAGIWMADVPEDLQPIILVER